MTREYLRHPRGRGKLYDDAEANRATYIDTNSSAGDSAKLRDCQLRMGTHAGGNCQIYGGRYYSSIVGGHAICAGDPEVRWSWINCLEVSGRPTIFDCELSGTTEVCDMPVITGIVAQDAVIYGSPSLLGTFTVTGRVHEGTWTRAPKHIKLPWCDLSECVDGKMLLNCYCRSVVWWLRFGPKVAKKWDWSEDMISVTLDTIRREFT